MNWTTNKTQVSLYADSSDVTGRPVDAFYALLGAYEKAVSTINELRRLNPDSDSYKIDKDRLKKSLPLWAPSALLRTRAAVPKEEQNSRIIQRTGLVQLDWDYPDIKDYDYDEVKQAIFALPFIAYVGLSCTGNGIWALAVIAEPERQREYMEQMFRTFSDYGLKPDTSKGRNYTDLRFVSYDHGHLWREDVEPLRIDPLKLSVPVVKSRPAVVVPDQYRRNHCGLINQQVQLILDAQVGQRWPTVQRAAYTLGGVSVGLNEIEQAIRNNPAFSGEEAKYLKCAADCFRDGQLKPLL